MGGFGETLSLVLVVEVKVWMGQTRHTGNVGGKRKVSGTRRGGVTELGSVFEGGRRKVGGTQMGGIVSL